MWSTRQLELLYLHSQSILWTSALFDWIAIAHTLFSFDIDVKPEYKLTKKPHNINYLPVVSSGQQYLDNITIRVVDDNGGPIDFGGETINMKLDIQLAAI